MKSSHNHSRRFYRQINPAEGMVYFTVKIKETDLWVAVDYGSYTEDLAAQLEDYIWSKRRELEALIREVPAFYYTLQPFVLDNRHSGFATVPALEMIRAGNRVGVGPMAAVAGSFAQLAGEFLLERVEEVIVENGGDIFLKVDKPCRVGVYAGDSPLSGKVALQISPEDTPLGVCTSSGKVGPSYSRGQADAVVVLSPSTPLADAAATALGNMVSRGSDFETGDCADGDCINGECKNDDCSNDDSKTGTYENGACENGAYDNGVSKTGTCENSACVNGVSKAGICHNGISENDLENILHYSQQFENIEGVLIICGDKMAARGNLKLCPAGQ